MIDRETVDRILDAAERLRHAEEARGQLHSLLSAGLCYEHGDALVDKFHCG